MAGTITAGTLSDGTNSTSTTNCIQGSAKAWVNFVGSTASINGSYNVSSVTRNSAGNYTINFTNALSSTGYAGTIATAYYASGSAPASVGEFWAGTRTTSAYQIAMQNSTQGAYQDSPSVSVCIFR